MSIYKIIDRFALVVALTASGAVLIMHQPFAAVAMLAIWPITRAVVSVLDVFYTFFTNRPLITTLAGAGHGYAPAANRSGGTSDEPHSA